MAATEGHYDLIVMGTHERRGIAHLMLGTVTEKVVRKAPCPLLIFDGERWVQGRADP